jgi:phage tail protein X
MEGMRDAFQGYLNENPEIDEVLNTYAEIEGVYRELLQAMGSMKQVQPIVEDSAKITISLPDAPAWTNNNGGEPGEAKEKATYSANS